MPKTTPATEHSRPEVPPVSGQIWDPALRAFHWLLVICVTAGWLLGQFGPDQMTLHFWFGYGVAGLLVFRLVWGLVGPRNARFSSFLTGPGKVLSYAKTLPQRRAAQAQGHNPLGGWSVVAMLLTLCAQVVTGLTLDPEDYINTGPLAGYVSSDWSREALALHHLFGTILLLLIVLHVGAILFYRFWKRTDLVTPMITGRPRD